MPNHTFLVSVVIPCFNAGRWIAEAIEGCLKQTYPHIEIIVVDDGSTDDSRDVVETYGERVRYVLQDRRGGSAARNRGYDLASGEYVLFHDADDVMFDDAIERLIGTLDLEDRAIAAVRWWNYEYVQGSWTKTRPGCAHVEPENSDYLWGWISGAWYIPPTGILWPYELVKAVGGWDENLKIPAPMDDGDLVMRALINGVALRVIEESGFMYRRHRHGTISVSRSRSADSLLSKVQVMNKIDNLLQDSDLIHQYVLPLAQAYHGIAAGGFGVHDEYARLCERRALDLAGSAAVTGTRVHRILCALFGLEAKAKLVNQLERVGLIRRESTRNRRRIGAS